MKEASFCRRERPLQKATTGQKAENNWWVAQSHCYICNTALHIRLRKHQGWRVERLQVPRRTRLSAMRLCLLYMIWKLHLWNPNNMAAQTRPKQWQHQQTCQHGWGKSHKAPPLDEKLPMTAEIGRISFSQEWASNWLSNTNDQP